MHETASACTGTPTGSLTTWTVAVCFVQLQAQFAVFSSSNVTAAYAFAARAHAGQTRKSGEPVLTHLLATAHILAELGLPEEVVAAGLLHDVLCDTPTTAAQLSAVLPASVVSLVSRVSQLNQLSQNYRDNTHTLEAEAMLDMLTGGCCTGAVALSICSPSHVLVKAVVNKIHSCILRNDGLDWFFCWHLQGVLQRLSSEAEGTLPDLNFA